MLALCCCIVTPLSAAPVPTAEQRACAVIKEAGKHVGETISFHGEYLTDHIERSVVVPSGCSRGIGLGGYNREVWKPIDSVDSPWVPRRHIEATFIGTLIKQRANVAQFAADDGVRFKVDHVTDVTWRLESATD
jgi:hypothetical protein